MLVAAKRGLVQFLAFCRTPDTFKDTDREGFASSHIAYLESPTFKEQGCRSRLQRVLKRLGRARIEKFPPHGLLNDSSSVKLVLDMEGQRKKGDFKRWQAAQCSVGGESLQC